MAIDAYWGVDSANPANHKLGGVKGHPTLYDYVAEQCGQAPDFWGRYVGGAFAITQAEVDFLFSKGTRILVIYNGATNSKSSVGGDYKAGVHDAKMAIAGADKAGVPAGVWIYGDIEPGWKCTSDWFKGWWDTMFTSPYGGMGGLYENPLAWNADNFAKPYLKALKGDSPVVYQDPPTKARYLYSQQKCKGCIKPGDITFDFSPAEPEGVWGVTVLWQYAIDCFKLPGSKWGLIDMDLADWRGYASMWAPNTPAPGGAIEV